MVSFSIIAQEENKELTILWDTSYSMLDKNVNEELAYLEDYFSDHNNTKMKTMVLFHLKLVSYVCCVTANWVIVIVYAFCSLLLSSISSFEQPI